MQTVEVAKGPCLLPDSLYGKLAEAVQQIRSLSSRFQWVGVYVLRGNTLELGPYVGETSEHTHIRVGEGVCGTAVLENQDQNVPDVRERPNYLACSLKTRSELVVLIRDENDRILGQIDIDSDLLNAFGPAEESSVQQIAKELGREWKE